MGRNRGTGGDFVNARGRRSLRRGDDADEHQGHAESDEASGTLVPANCSLKAPNLLQKLRESVKARDTSGEHRAEAFMGEVIEGPWRRRGGPDLMRALSEEIARMTAALERLRELHKRGEALDLRGDVDAGRT
jgi:hypothetical protein